ncbi:MAG: hypothetical protein ACK4JF_10055 [Methylohalobius sp.]
MARGKAWLKLLFLLLLSAPQAFLPLLHAHLGREQAPAVLHIPGLERYYHPGELGIYQSSPLWEEIVVCSDDGVRREPQAGPILTAVLPEPVPSPPLESQVKPACLLPVQALSSRSYLPLLPRAPPA